MEATQRPRLGWWKIVVLLPIFFLLTWIAGIVVLSLAAGLNALLGTRDLIEAWKEALATGYSVAALFFVMTAVVFVWQGAILLVEISSPAAFERARSTTEHATTSVRNVARRGYPYVACGAILLILAVAGLGASSSSDIGTRTFGGIAIAAALIGTFAVLVHFVFRFMCWGFGVDANRAFGGRTAKLLVRLVAASSAAAAAGALIYDCLPAGVQAAFAAADKSQAVSSKAVLAMVFAAIAAWVAVEQWRSSDS